MTHELFVKAAKKLIALSDDADEKAIKKALKEFEDDDKIELEDVADKIMVALGEAEEEEEAPKAKGKKEAPKDNTPEGEEVEAADLSKGDVVSVYWKEEEEWFEGTVTSTKGGVKVKYDVDDSVEVINPKEHTKIILLEEAE